MPRSTIRLNRLISAAAIVPETIDPAFGATAQPRPPGRRKRGREPMEVRRARMRREGARLMARYGFGNVSLADVTRACGIPKGSAHYYYNGWEELLGDIVDQHILKLHEQVGDAEDAHAADPAEHRLVAMATALLETIRDNEAEHRVQFVALHVMPPALADGLKMKHRWLAARIGEVLAAALPALDTRPDVLVPATMSFLNLAGGTVLWFREDGGLGRQDYARMLVRPVLEGARVLLTDGAAVAADPLPQAG